ncbi:MAG TPA: xanthine dehydrogenase family protein molybdopterin-binding subunit [Stellaceae bacterium]|nr:xanthine dehydrogenase family protein molybdopterin-binding subunit [Stellaceae bacterium]
MDATEVGIGAPVRRVEDERLLTGGGRFADDVQVPGMAFAYVVRSPHAHARILGIDAADARAVPGVLAIFTAEDTERDGIAGLACTTFPKLPPGSRSYCPVQPILARGKVRHVGDRVALVVAETLDAAKDAGERLSVQYDALPGVTLGEALSPNAPKIWDEAHDNLSFALEFGDRRAVDESFASAAHVTTIALHYPRAAPNSLEPRSALAYRDPTDGRFTLCLSTQDPFRVRDLVSRLLRLPQLSLRVKALDVGGAFGMKGQVYPEEVLVTWAAVKLGRPVKWTADRGESIASDMHGRHQIAAAALALDRDGRALAFRTSVDIDVGAYLSMSAGVPPHNAGVSYPGTYRIPRIHAAVRAIFTNSSQLGPYRGTAKPEASFVLDHLMEKAAREMGLDPVELRRRNLISVAEMPYRTPGGNIYDCGDFEHVLEAALELAEWRGFAERRAAAEQRGRRRGIGLAMHCQRAGTASERMEVRVAENGSAAVYVGTLATGQGHETMFAQMVSEWLGVPLAEVRVFQGDTDRVLFGRGSFAQRSMSTGGSALKLAADEVVRKAKRLAAWMMEVSEADIAFERGTFRVAGTDRQVTLRDVAQKSYSWGIPETFGIGLDGVGAHLGPNTFPNGCMIAEVEVDTETGVIRVDRLTAVDDTGTVVNPLTLEGQLHGSIAQGLGEALLEAVVYERGTGQLLTGSFMDYAMPRADVMPDIVAEVAPVPTKTNLVGSKGGSEAGNVGAPAAIINAVIDALAPWGILDLPLPARPELVWRAIRAAGAPSRT